MYFADALTLDAPRRTSDGYMAVRARAARTGVYAYTGREIDPSNTHGLRDKASVNVLRDENTVFDAKAARSFIGKPVTDDHPSVAVNSTNWRDHSRGVVMGALRDGDYLAFDIMVTDQSLIDKIDAGKRDLSNGYAAELEFGSFKAADGTACEARQSRIIAGNHVAVVKDGRAGKDCAIADTAPCDSAPQSFLDSLTQEKPVKNFMLDGLTVDLANADTAIATVQALRDQRDAATGTIKTLETKAVTDAATIVAKDAEIAKFTADLAGAKLTPQQMRDAGKAYADICAKAKASGITVTDAMDENAIMRAVVDKGMGVAAKDYTDEHIAVAFKALTNGSPIADRAAPSGQPIIANDTKSVRDLARASRY